MRVLIISDLHLCEDGQLVGGQDTAAAFERGWSVLQPLLVDADFLVIAGDIAQQGSVQTYRYLQQITADYADKLLLTVGNKDNRAHLLDAFGDTHACDSGHIQTVRHTADASVIVLDSLLPDCPQGQLCDARLNWLHQQLLQADARSLLVVLHHPPVLLGVAALDDVAVQEGRAALLNLLSQYPGSCLIMSGHHHIQRLGYFQGLRYCIGPAFSGPPAQFGIWGQAPVFGPGPNGMTAVTLYAEREADVQFFSF